MNILKGSQVFSGGDISHEKRILEDVNSHAAGKSLGADVEQRVFAYLGSQGVTQTSLFFKFKGIFSSYVGRRGRIHTKL